MQPSDSLPPVGRGSGRPWPVAYPVPRATRRKKGLPGAWAVLFQRAVGSDPAGCASRRAHRVETAIAFRLHNALGTQNERYFVAVNPTAHSLACLRIGVFVTADAARLATGVGGSPFTGRVSHPLDGKQSFMTSPHRHSPLTSLAWSHRATTPSVGAVGSRPTGMSSSRRRLGCSASSEAASTEESDRILERSSEWGRSLSIPGQERAGRPRPALIAPSARVAGLSPARAGRRRGIRLLATSAWGGGRRNSCRWHGGWVQVADVGTVTTPQVGCGKVVGLICLRKQAVGRYTR